MDAEADAAGTRQEEPQREAEVTPQTLRHLQEELQKAKDDHNMARGAISSLQRELERQECHLRRTRSEKAELQKKLTVQQEQLQAMTDKFHSLREEHKHEEVLAMMEEENRSLRQVVGEQESKLAEQNKLISELEETVTQLRAEGLSSCCQVQELKRAQKEIQSQAEALQHSELQARVALESTSSKFERFRSKILQAVFSIEGSQAPSAELTDEELLDAMQKIIKERMEFHRVLKQKGIKVPSLPSSTTTASSAKERRKSSIK